MLRFHLIDVTCLFLPLDMDESEQKSISSAIVEVLPDLSASVPSSVVETLNSLGVETTQVVQYIQEVLRPIQARKLVSAWTQISKYISSHFLI